MTAEDLTDLVYLVSGLLVLGLLGVVGWGIRYTVGGIMQRLDNALNQFTETSERLANKLDAHEQKNFEDIAAMREQLKNHEIESARTYMTRTEIKSIWEGVSVDLKDIGKKLDKFIDLVNELSKKQAVIEKDMTGKADK